MLFGEHSCLDAAKLLWTFVWYSVLWRCWLGGRKGIRPGTFLVPAHLGSPGKGPLNGCVFVWYSDDIQPCDEDTGMEPDDADFEFVSAADIVDSGNGWHGNASQQTALSSWH